MLAGTTGLTNALRFRGSWSYTHAALSQDSPGLLEGGADAFKDDRLSGRRGSRAACWRPHGVPEDGVRSRQRGARPRPQPTCILWWGTSPRQWKKASGYHRQSRVENTFFRYKSIIGDGLRARSPAGQGSEIVLGCEILNRMTELGRPVSYRIGQ